MASVALAAAIQGALEVTVGPGVPVGLGVAQNKELAWHEGSSGGGLLAGRRGSAVERVVF